MCRAKGVLSLWAALAALGLATGQAEDLGKAATGPAAQPTVRKQVVAPWVADIYKVRKGDEAANYVVQVQRRGAENVEHMGVEGRLYPQDTVQTDQNTLAQITFLSQASLALQPQTRLCLQKHTSERTTLTLVSGAMRIKAKPVSEGGTEMEIITTAARVRIRGTTVIVVHYPAAPGRFLGTTVVYLIRGVVICLNEATQVEEQLARAGVIRMGDIEEGQADRESITLEDVQKLLLRYPNVQGGTLTSSDTEVTEPEPDIPPALRTPSTTRPWVQVFQVKTASPP